MKRIFAILLLLAASATVWGFNLSQITYLQAELPSSGPIVQIVSMKEFISLVEKKRVGIIYLVNAGKPDQLFAFVLDGAVYRTPADGFRNLARAQVALKKGLKTDGELTVAQQFHLEDFSSIYYANSEYFKSAVEYEDAIHGGFKGTANEFPALGMPPSIRWHDFREVLLPQVTWLILVQKAAIEGSKAPVRTKVTYGPRARSTSARTPQDALTTILMQNKVVPRSDWTWGDYNNAVKKLDANAEYQQWIVQHFGTYKQLTDGNLKAALVGEKNPDFITVMAALGVHRSVTETSSRQLQIARSRAYGTNPPTISPGPSYVPNSMKIEQRLPTDSDVFAVARLFGLTTAAEYLALNAALQAGYRSISDEKASRAGGFQRPADYYRAVRLGVTTLAESNKVAGLPNATVAKEYLDLLSELTKLKETYTTKNADELALAYALVNLPQGVPYGIAGILESLKRLQRRYLDPSDGKICYFSRAAKTVSETPWNGRRTTGVGLQEYSQSITAAHMEAVLRGLESLPWVSRIGRYNRETGVFVRS